jgi:hypothetical protein
VARNRFVRRAVLVGLVFGLAAGNRLWAQQGGSWPPAAVVPVPAQPAQLPAPTGPAYLVPASSSGPAAPTGPAYPVPAGSSGPAAPTGPAYPVSTNSFNPPAPAGPTPPPYPMVQPVQPMAVPLAPEQSSCLRGLLARPSEPLPPELFIPFMLGDFSRITLGLASDYKIAEGESPRPIDRLFYQFSYFDNVDKRRFSNPLEPVHGVNLYDHVFGFEKTLFDGLVSVGLRVPFHTIEADGKQFTVTPSFFGGPSVLGPGGRGFTDTEFGDITAIAKVVLLENRATGNLLSAGIAVTFPTADSPQANAGIPVTTFVQPFVGGILSWGDLFVQGFTSVTLPVAHQEAIVLFNDIGVGYFVYRDKSHSGWLTAIAPTLELHIITPLRQSEFAEEFESIEDLRLHDVVDVTLGTTFEFVNRATLGIGVVTPLTGPRPFDVAALAQLNWRF